MNDAMANSRSIDELPEDESITEIDENSWSMSNVQNVTLNESKYEIPIDKPGEYPYETEAYPSDDIILLGRLCRLGYFNGEHHLEEIMYLENIRRSQLLQILDKFRNVLITSENEDPAMAMFYSQPPIRMLLRLILY